MLKMLLSPTISYKFSGIGLLVVILVLSFSACKKQKGEPLDTGYDYYPGTVGSYVVYDVDSIDYNPFDVTIDTFRFQIKEVVESEYEDATGATALRIERYKRLSPQHGWWLQDVWSATKTATTYQQTEENRRLMKLAFPPSQGKRWDGNAYNTDDEDQYEYEYTDLSVKVNDMDFDSSLSVFQFYDSTLIDVREGREIYARGVGMIYKRYRRIDFQASAVGGGVDLSMKINSWGNE